MVDKMKIAITKLNSTILYPQQAYLYFNAYLLKSMYFGSDIMWLNKEQDENLRRIYKELIAVILGLGKKCSRAILYIQ